MARAGRGCYLLSGRFMPKARVPSPDIPHRLLRRVAVGILAAAWVAAGLAVRSDSASGRRAGEAVTDSFTVTVKTGDRTNAATKAHVRIIVYGPGCRITPVPKTLNLPG